MSLEHSTNLNVFGNPDAQILVICDVPGQRTFDEGLVMPPTTFAIFSRTAYESGLDDSQFAFMTPAPPMPEEVLGSDKREAEFLKAYAEEFKQVKSRFPNVKLVMTLGATATKQALEKPVKITRVRGQLMISDHWKCPVLPMFSPSHVARRPEITEIFQTDFRVVGTLNANAWDAKCVESGVNAAVYEWCFDVQPYIEYFLSIPANRRAAAIDTESKGGQWYRGADAIVFQLSYRKGHAILVPLDCEYWNQWQDPRFPFLSQRHRAHLVGQLRRLCGPEIGLQVTGHNFGSDIHKLRKLGIQIACWQHDSMQLVFVTNENILEKSLDEAVRLNVPRLAGYADEFNKDPIHCGKEHMECVPPDKMVRYGGGDTDGCLELTHKLVKEGKTDSRNWNCYRGIQMPALRMFPRMEEHGMQVDRDALRELGKVAEEQTHAWFEELIEQVPDKIKRRHIDAGSKGKGTGLSFSRDQFVADVLFSKDGLGLTPLVFTASTQRLPPEQRIPSVSTKDHLPYFSQENAFVARLIEYQKLAKMRTTYIGLEGGILIPQRRATAPPKFTEPTGFWQYLSELGFIHPSFFLHRTNTGRTASAYPNAQNFPKRGYTEALKRIVEAFRRIFILPPGWVFVEADLSQAELRIAAWMANEPTMLRIYNALGGDIHAATACIMMGITPTQFLALPKDEQKLKRHYAKAVNFGLIYGAGWKTLQTYAKTTYGVTFTDAEAQRIRKAYFETYSNLPRWHDSVREFVNTHGYVRALHGALRRLPNIWSPDEAIRGECQRQAINAPVQRFGSDLGLMGLTRFGRDCDWSIMRPWAFIHDSTIAVSREEHAEECASALKFYNESAPLGNWFGMQAPPLPILSDVSISEPGKPINLASLEERPDIRSLAPRWYREDLDLVLPA